MGVLYARVNGQWEAISARDSTDVNWNTAWGVVASAARTTSASGIGGGAYVDISGLSVTFTAKAGRRYVATLYLLGVASSTAGDWIATRIQNGAGTTTYAGAQQHLKSAANSQDSVIVVSPPLDLVAGSNTLKAAIYFGAGTGQIPAANDMPNILTVEDVGPATQSPTTQPTPITQWNAAWGVVANGTVLTNPVNIATNGQAIALTQPLAFSPLPGRRYRATFVMRAMQPTAAHATSTINLLNAANNPYAGTADRWYQSQYGQGYNNLSTSWIIPDGAPADMIRVTMTSATNTGMTAFPSEFYVEDIGPQNYAQPTTSPGMIVAATSAENVAVGASAQVTVLTLAVPAAAYAMGQKYLVTWSVRAGHPGTAGVFDVNLTHGSYATSHQENNGNGTGKFITYQHPFVGDGASKSCTIWLNTWGGQAVWTYPSISIQTYT